MLGLGTGIVKGGGRTSNLGIITDNLVLKHNYDASQVHQVSTGAADINADAAANEYIDVGTIEITTNDVSVCAWVYITDWVNYGGIFANRYVSSPNQGFELRCANGAQKFQILIDEATDGSASLLSSTKNSNQWYHVCAVMDRSSTVSLYVDGVADGTPVDITDQADSLTHATVAKIGQNYAATEMRGYVCNVGYWNRVLTQAEIKSIMWKDYAGLTSSEKTSMVSWWNLDSTITSTSVLDNHYGGGSELGSELVTNGSFTTDSDWNKNSNWEIDTTGGATAVADGSADTDINQVITSHPVANNVYKVTFDVVSVTAGSVHFTFGGATGADRNSVGTYSEYITASNTDRLKIDSHVSNLFAGSVDNVSVKLVNGNTGTLS